MQFKDHFSGHSALYAQGRPRYPDELFRHLAGLAPAREHAWDAGTGNGQAALSLAGYFETVTASDASAGQLASSVPHPRVHYLVALAEVSGLPGRSVDLVTCASSVHWFDLDRFYPEVLRVLKPGGVIAVWAYTFPRISPEIDAASGRLAHEILEGYWPAENRLVWERYEYLPFPFPELPPPPVRFVSRWTLAQLVAYLGTWSSTRRYIAHNGTNPVDQVMTNLRQSWGAEDQERDVNWEAGIRIGRVS